MPNIGLIPALLHIVWLHIMPLKAMHIYLVYCCEDSGYYSYKYNHTVMHKHSVMVKQSDKPRTCSRHAHASH